MKIQHNGKTAANEKRLFSALKKYGDEVTIVVDGKPQSVTHLEGYGTYVANGVLTPQSEWISEAKDRELAAAIRESNVVWKEFHATRGAK